MGLDLVEIVFSIEKTFEIELPMDDLEGLTHDYDIMVGDLYDYILKRLHLREFARQDIGLNYGLWRDVQSALCSVTNVPADRVQLKTPLDELFPRKTRRATWQAFRDACSYRVRTLDYPKAVRYVGFALAAAMVLFEQFQIWQIPGAGFFWILLGILGAWMLAETYVKVLWILAPLRRSFPSRMVTVKDLCRAILATNYTDICQDADIPLDDRSLAVWQQLTQILVEVTGVDADEITFRSRLFRDLGAG